MRAFVCLIPHMLRGERFERGDMYVPDEHSGSACMGLEWAWFEPPDWLEGVPELLELSLGLFRIHHRGGLIAQLALAAGTVWELGVEQGAVETVIDRSSVANALHAPV